MPSIFEKYQLKQVINASGRMTAPASLRRARK